MKLREVFVAGGQPTVTYVARRSSKAHRKLRDHLEYGHSIASVVGPTKSRKTVLCRKLLPPKDYVWISGGMVRSEDDFWKIIVTELATPSSEVTSTASNSETAGEAHLGFSNLLRALLPLQFAAQATRKKSTRSAKSQRFEFEARTAAIKGLAQQNKGLVVDDFHLIPRECHPGIVAALKEPVRDGTRVVLISVPHRGFDAQRAVPDMTLRVETIVMDDWTEEDLMTIATSGFDKLNVNPSASLVQTFASEAMGSPHLMQFFCRQFCASRDVTEKLDQPKSFRLGKVQEFFKAVSNDIGDDIIRQITKGKRARKRDLRSLKDGSQGDIYSVVLAAIGQLLPAQFIVYDDIHAKVFDLVDHPQPQKSEVTRVLERMSNVAELEIEGQPVIECDQAARRVYITDPFFGFYVRWGNWWGQI